MAQAGEIFQWKILCIHDRPWEAEAQANGFLAKAPRELSSQRKQTRLASFASLAPLREIWSSVSGGAFAPLNPFTAGKFQFDIERSAAVFFRVGVHVIKEGVDV